MNAFPVNVQQLVLVVHDYGLATFVNMQRKSLELWIPSVLDPVNGGLFVGDDVFLGAGRRKHPRVETVE